MRNATEQNRALISKAFEGLAKGDPSHFMPLFDESIEWRVVGSSAWSKRAVGLDAVVRDLVEPLFARFAGPYLTTPELIIADGEHVAVQAKGNAETLEGVRYDNEYCFVFTLKGGKIIKVVEYMDTILADRALGTGD
ncbi:nuclear transport factor 2 family protein [Erythrobacter sp. SCSIO 43205]|uniref:nuclear transport factor 2 family protein n=1 Tax=Erythrobacter sp. SCSIO 43205 TaxID=2779361 RepID=UPI001CA97F7D|nr:nuclear transport factor 2 family protein [Erythrobacter sp. SCSIO 43205]UAB77584.1 nuclear transport factor 2 family protein [Erythrobacter sp. SCSIO 43205]